MEPPPGISLSQKVKWACKEPALVVWNDADRSDISSLGLPCPTGKPTLLTLWVGQDAKRSTYVMLHLRISVRISKRRKTLDHYLLPTIGFGATEGCSIVNLEDASDNVRQCLEEVYGNSSTKKCLCVPFHQPKRGHVLMPYIPEGAPCLGGTALHLLTLFRSLSYAKSFKIFVGHSSYAQHALMNLEIGVSAGGPEVNVPDSYNNGGVLDDWRQIGVDCADSQRDEVASGQEDQQDRHTNVKAVDRTTSPEVGAQPTCSPPPYSPPVQIIQLPVTPQAKACLKRSRVSTTPEANQPSPKSARRDNSSSPSLSNVLHVSESIVRSFSLESTVYSPTIINTPSTVDDNPGIKPTIFTTRQQHPEYAASIDDGITGTTQEKVRKIASSFTSAPEVLDAISPRSIMRALSYELRALVTAQVPLLTEQTLQRIMEELCSSLEYTQKLAEVALQETSDDLKTELRLEKDNGIEDIDDHAQDVLCDVKEQMEDLASGHLIAFEDLLQRTSEQLTQTLKVFLSIVAKAVAMAKEHENKADLTDSQAQHTAVPPALRIPNESAPSPGIIATSSASTAAKLFLDDFRDLGTADKIKVLERLTHQQTAEVFLTVNTELREVWVASWIA